MSHAKVLPHGHEKPVVEVCGDRRGRRPLTSICRGDSNLTSFTFISFSTTVQHALFYGDLSKTNSMLSRASVILVAEHCVLREEIVVHYLCLV